MKRFDAEPVLDQLKDFQRATAEYVFDRMYFDDSPAHRFLVADEVGLGKTLVARGVIAKTIEYLQESVERIDVVYVCSNVQIARQNVRRLHMGDQEHFEVADRITMLPATAHELNKNRINIVSFTPGTSFDLKRGGGLATERAMMRLMLMRMWGRRHFHSQGSMRVFQGGVRTLAGFRRTFNRIEHDYGSTLDKSIVKNFGRLVAERDEIASAAGDATLLERFKDLCEVFRTNRPVAGWSNDEKRLRTSFIGEMRDLLARSALESLQPDLIILDEFQRFKHLLASPDGEDFSPAAELAHELFGFVDSDTGRNSRVLLLSATPYKMLTTIDDADEDHHNDLVETVRFLLQDDLGEVEELRRGLRDLRRALMQAGRDGGAAARVARDKVQAILRRVMVRTERLASEKSRGGMLSERECSDLNLDQRDIRSFTAAARVARSLNVADPVEYWKSAPYLLNYMDGYKLRAELDAANKSKRRELLPHLRQAGLLDWDALQRFDQVNSDNPRLRWLLKDTVGRGAWKLLWVPPSLPYLDPGGPFAEPEVQGFTKRLIFSSWTMVPTAISTLLSFEAERQMVRAGGRRRYENTPEGRQSRARLLEFSYSAGRLTGMPVLGILYPSVVLAREGDPLRLCAESGGEAVSPEKAISAVARRMKALLDELVRDIEAAGGEIGSSGRADETWYWAAPLWLDWLDDPSHIRDFFGNKYRLTRAFTDRDPSAAGDRFKQHLQHAGEVASTVYPSLGPMPEELPEVLARMALTGPGPTALRALARPAGRDVSEKSLRFGACKVAWAIRSLFNAPEVIELVRAQYPGDPYWMRVLDYSLAGNLQSVLDEYVHVLVPSRGHVDPTDEDAVDDLAAALHDTISTRTVNFGVSKITVDSSSVTIDKRTRLRAHFAVRLQDETSDDGTVARMGEVREAFNSPFWPFVLATTSAGQEGLDFHPFCHAIVHWNLPSNPVDLEQREGRIHRFKGHAVRKNLATEYGRIGRSGVGDPWEVMFEKAREERPQGLTDIYPYWVYALEDGARIERYIPALPLSRDKVRANALRRAVASYRLAFGQPRQEDLLAYLAGTIDPEELERLTDELTIDLSP